MTPPFENEKNLEQEPSGDARDELVKYMKRFVHDLAFKAPETLTPNYIRDFADEVEEILEKIEE